MNSTKKFFVKFLLLIFILPVNNLFADNHDTKSKKVSKEEPLPLNDPFVGDSSLTGGSKILSDNPEELENNMSLYKFKLVGVMTSENDKGFASLIDENGEVINISLFEELSPGVQLVAINNREAVFDNNENLLAINFKNQIIERSK